jgi:hypothetical protein
VDPNYFEHTQEYINILKNRIFNLERKVEGLEKDLKEATLYHGLLASHWTCFALIFGASARTT